MKGTLTDKQNITDNSLATTAKTVVGGINEIWNNLSNHSKQLLYNATSSAIQDFFYVFMNNRWSLQHGAYTVGLLWDNHVYFVGTLHKISNIMVCDVAASDGSTYVIYFEQNKSLKIWKNTGTLI